MAMSGTELKSALRALGLTQAEFAKLKGEHRTTISGRIHGRPGYPPSRSDETIVRLARGEPIDQLLRELG